MITVRLPNMTGLYPILLWTSLFWIGLTSAADSTPREQDILSLENQIAASGGLSGSEKESLSAELIQSRKRLNDLQAQAIDLEVAQSQASAFDVEVRKLQGEIQTQTETPPNESPRSRDEPALATEAAQRELSVWQVRRTLFEARELEYWLSRRANVIAEEMAAAAQQFTQSGLGSVSSAPGSTPDLLGEPGDSTTARVKALIGGIDAYVARETFNLLQQEIATLAPRQTIAALKGRELQLRLENQARTLDQYWRLLHQIRSEAVQTRLDDLTQSQNSSSNATQLRSTVVDERVRWANAELTLLDQELAVNRRSAQMADSIMQIYQVRQLLTQINTNGGLNDSLADMMRELRQSLPDSQVIFAEWQELQKRQTSLQVDRILWEGVLRGNSASASSTNAGDGVFPGEAGGRLEALVSLLTVANRVSDRMTSLEMRLLETQTRTVEVASTLDGTVLWLRSNASVELSWITDGYKGLRWISNPESWRGVGTTMLSGVRTAPIALVVLTLCLLLTIGIRSRLAVRLTQSASGVGNVGEDRYWNTPAAICISLLWALPIPLALMLLYWTLKKGFSVPGSLTPALTGALLATASTLFVVLFFKTLCRADGVFSRHFEWEERSVDRLYRHLTWFAWVSAPCAAIFTLSLLSGRTDLRYGLALMTFIIASMALSVLLHVCLRPGRGVAFKLANTKAPSPVAHMSIWTLIAIPAVVGLLPLAGYFDIAMEILNRAFLSAVYLMITAVVVGLVLREFMVAHRRMSLRKARAIRLAREAERSAQLNTPISGDATPDLSFIWDDDYKRIATQAQKLLKFAGVVLFLCLAWMVWKPLFPVLDVFSDIELWRANGAIGSTLGDQSITLGKLLFALGVILLGVVGSRNLRGLLEILVFERLGMDAGARYAINAIASYILIGTTILIGIAQLGVDWSRLQWIVAALGVGLGFGLQEIVANFISGLIILFERPIRVGDTVSIGELSGTVSNIQIRATTLTDFDNREVLLPNKSIITENVTNWTLHDSVTRILLEIGVAYGSDIDQVRTLIFECLNTVDDVLVSPEPTVFFVNHGASALDFEIRAFVATPAHRLPVTHALNSAINASLSRHGIEIPFPQNVVHLHSATDDSDRAGDRVSPEKYEHIGFASYR